MTPRATYRLQVRPGFDLDDAAAVVPHLARLGVSHVYCSPLLTSASGSTHGYDVVDPTTVDPQRGGEAGLRRLVDRLHEHGLGLVLDIVPNHVAVLTRENRWWWDLLTHGPDSAWAHVFDVSWRDSPAGVPQVVLPMLGVEPDEAVEAGHLRLVSEDGVWLVAYHDDRFPVRPGSLLDAGVDGEGLVPSTLGPDEVRAVLAQQHHELVQWRTGADRLGYRRFFDVKELAGVRMEDDRVFEATHATVLRLVREGLVDGLRVDHPDGLRDPAGYARRLRDEVGDDTWLVFEKILEPGEDLRDWPVDGTVGYELARLLTGLQVYPAGESTFTRLWRELEGPGVPADVEQAIAEGKRLVVTDLLGAEWLALARRVAAVANDVGVTAHEGDVAAVLRELLVAFPVYRTYVVPERDEVTDADREIVQEAVAAARPHVAREDLLDLVARLLVLDAPDEADGGTVAEVAARFQQLSGPVMAKGVEDTAWYRYLRFPGMNEVGGAPGRFGIPVTDVHEALAERARAWPAAMSTTSTHDTKRSEDVRARLAVLSEVPAAWEQVVAAWRAGCAELHGDAGPGPVLEHLAWHTAVGAWPIDGDRLADYLLKAARERKVETSWTDAHEAFESDLAAYARALVDHDGFTGPLADLLDVVVPAGRVNSLAQVLVKLTAPGVPDVYQGNEVWDLSLVDPDNRRPVPWGPIEGLVAELDAGLAAAEAWARADTGLPKLLVTRRALQLRAEHPEVFAHGGYEPVPVDGSRAHHVLAFARTPRSGGDRVVTVVPRLTLGLGEAFGSWDWGDTTLRLGDGSWHETMTGVDVPGGAVRLDALLARFPVALLVGDR